MNHVNDTHESLHDSQKKERKKDRARKDNRGYLFDVFTTSEKRSDRIEATNNFISQHSLQFPHHRNSTQSVPDTFGSLVAVWR
jgi:hypothetical protein